MNLLTNLLFVLSFVITFLTNCGFISNEKLTLIVFIESLFFYLQSKPNYRKKLLLFFVLLLLFLNYYIASSGIGGIMGILTVFLYVYAINDKNIIASNVLKIIPLIAYLFLLFYVVNLNKFIVNTNTLGLNAYFLLLTIIPYIASYKDKSKFCKIISLLIVFTSLIISSWIILFSECRSALFALIGLSAFYLVTFIKKISLKIHKLLSLVFLLSGGIVAWIGIYLSKTNIELFFVKWLLTENKQSLFSNRELIWEELMKNFYESPILGCGNHISLMSFDSLAVHNSFLAIMCLYGILVFVIIYMGLWNVIKKIVCYDNSLIRYYYCSFCSVLIIGCYESVLVDDLKFYTILPLIFANQLVNKKRLSISK